VAGLGETVDLNVRETSESPAELGWDLSTHPHLSSEVFEVFGKA
jgi:hypothetical protein